MLSAVHFPQNAFCLSFINQNFMSILIKCVYATLNFYCGACFCVGKTRARDAALNAIQSPLLDIGIERATGIVWNITGGNDLTLYEVALSGGLDLYLYLSLAFSKNNPHPCVKTMLVTVTPNVLQPIVCPILRNK